MRSTVYYTGQSLDRGVVRGHITHHDAELGLTWIELDDDPQHPVCCTTADFGKYVFQDRRTAAHAAFHDVAAAEGAAARVRDAHEQKRAQYRRLLDDLIAEMNGAPAASIGAGARVIRHHQAEENP